MKFQWYASFSVDQDKLWALISESKNLKAWLDPEAELDIAANGKLSLNGQTQFRGLTNEVQLISYEPGKGLVFSWPIKNILTEVKLEIESHGNGSKLNVSVRIDDDAELISPPRSNFGVLKHYWKTNLASLKFFAETGRAIDRIPLKPRETKEALLSMTYAVPIERVWNAITKPEEMDQWLSKKAKVDLRPGGKITYAWDHGATKILKVDPPKHISYTWVIEDDESVLSWDLTTNPNGSTDLQLRHSGFSEKYPLRAMGYTEGWFAFVHFLGLYLEKGLRTYLWSNLNEDSNS